MTSYDKLERAINTRKTMLCIGLDSTIAKLPPHMPKTAENLLKFNFQIIEATKDIPAAYKINTAMYEELGEQGWDILKKSIKVIPDDVFLILDAKRGDIGNTSMSYAKSLFDTYHADAVTVAPYMGEDSISPFLEYNEKFVFLLALTSNKGSQDFQRLICDGKPLYKHVIAKSSEWASHEQLGYVVGATHPGELGELRDENPKRIFLIPGVGAQGGDVNEVMKANKGDLSLINVSRGISYASSGEDFAEVARAKAIEYAEAMSI
jgi:orotidine-5'-phosphate decarboxylase